ncbi:MAG: hypothetical protein K2J99_08110 [Lachnospiraceae bacterium]|nr:hypothetical protein [Lachnospiraceae bacterium]
MSKKKKTREKDKRKKQKKRDWRELIYNCPYMLAVGMTSLVMIIYSDEIGIRAVVREAETAIVQVMGMNISTQEIALEQTADQMVKDAADLENQSMREQMAEDNAGICKGENDEIQSGNELNKDVEAEENQGNTDKRVKGVTKFEIYEPQETDSRYYSDAGKVALTTEYPYSMESDSYFNDAAFLGDSRTLGISDYAGLDAADFYCDSGMTIFKLLEPEGVTYQKTGNKEDLSQVLQQKKYGKIYIMLGMNELGYGNTDMYLEQYRKVVDQIREWQPGSIIYIMANLHVSKEKNNAETEFNNININDKNAASAQLANGTDIFYLDANPLFTDEEGFLNAELTFDGVHLYAQHYDAWRQFLMEHAVEPDGQETAADANMAQQVQQENVTGQSAEQITE